jgi:hypothetical protein
MSIESSQGCASPSCSGDINANCPNAQMAVKDASGRIAGCLTSCGAKCAPPHVAISSNPFAASMDRPRTLRTAAAAPTTRPPPAPKRRSSTILILRTYAPMLTPTPTTSPLLPLSVGFETIAATWLMQGNRDMRQRKSFRLYYSLLPRRQSAYSSQHSQQRIAPQAYAPQTHVKHRSARCQPPARHVQVRTDRLAVGPRIQELPAQVSTSPESAHADAEVVEVAAGILI